MKLMKNYDEIEMNNIIQEIFKKLEYAETHIDVYENGICIQRMLDREHAEDLIRCIFKMHIVFDVQISLLYNDVYILSNKRRM